MASSSFNKFNTTVQNWGDGTGGDLNTDTLMILLTNTVPNAADTVVDTTTTTCTVKSTSNAAEIAAGGGYTKTGLAIGSSAYSQSGGVGSLTGNAVVWTASGGGFGPFRYAVLYDITAGTTSTRPVLAWWDYGSAVTLTAPETFTINSSNNGNWNSTYPVLTLT
jgi:hypothetical protein